VDIAAADPFDVLIRMTSQLFGPALHRKGNTTVTFADGRLPGMNPIASLKGQASQIHATDEKLGDHP